MTVSEYKKYAMKQRLERDNLSSKLYKLKAEKEDLAKRVQDLDKAVDIVSRVGIAAQREINTVIEELVTKAIQSVFGDNFAFKVEDEVKRNQPETYFYILENGHKQPLDDSGCGCGLVDVASLALRVVMWAIQVPRTSPVMILDEPFKYLDGERLEYAGIMLKELSSMLGIQFIIITHKDQMMDCADVMYKVKKIGDESTVTLVKGFEDE